MRVIEGALTKKEVHAILAKFAEAICKELPSDSRYAKIVLLQDLDRDLRNTQVTITYEDLVPHGHWISLTDCSNAGVYCSICNKKVWKEDYAWCNRKNKLRSNFCPNCGAKMDEENS